MMNDELYKKIENLDTETAGKVFKTIVKKYGISEVILMIQGIITSQPIIDEIDKYAEITDG